MKKNFIDRAKEFWYNEDGFIALAALALMAIGTAVSTVGQMKAAEAQKVGLRMKANAQKIEAARERTRQIRAARAQRAQILQAGENAGVGESSSVKSGAAGASTQAFNNIVGINQQESEGQAQSAISQQIVNAQGAQTLGQGISSIGGAVFAGKSELNDIFGIKQP